MLHNNIIFEGDGYYVVPYVHYALPILPLNALCFTHSLFLVFYFVQI